MSLQEKLLNIQKELKAPKNQRNTFGNYNYRSCEDILEAVKPLLVENQCILQITDTLEYIGERYYIKATAVLSDYEGNSILNTAYAREEESKKGMDGAQITGSSSSYARKYALNGLFLIDDTKDADSDEYTSKAQEKINYNAKLKEYIKANNLDMNEIAKSYNLNAKSSQEDFKKVLEELTKC